MYFDGVPFINPINYMDSIGFSIYAYEGVGAIIPVEDITRDKSSYIEITKKVMTTMLVLYISFSVICVASYGDLLNTPMITDMLP